jgi:hypothetical protein
MPARAAKLHVWERRQGAIGAPVADHQFGAGMRHAVEIAVFSIDRQAQLCCLAGGELRRVRGRDLRGE